MTVVDMVSINELMRIRYWADQKLEAGEEPPWAWYQYMKLREALDAIIAGMGVVARPTDDPHVTLPMG